MSGVLPGMPRPPLQAPLCDTGHNGVTMPLFRALSRPTWSDWSSCRRRSQATWRRWVGLALVVGGAWVGWARAASPTRPSSPQNMLGNQMLPVRVLELEEEVRNLRKINRDLFDFSTRIITRPSK